MLFIAQKEIGGENDELEVLDNKECYLKANSYDFPK